MTICTKCGEAMEADEARELHGKALCEDCYLDGVNPPKACDPWAVHTARSFGAQGKQYLTEHQEKILSMLRAHGAIEAKDLIARLEMTEGEFRSAFATLRHMELARGFKKGEDIYYTLFCS